MKTQDQVNLLGKAQEQLAMMITFGAPEGIVLALAIVRIAGKKYAGISDVRHNASLLHKFGL
jgi:hypothetical protein